MRLSHNAVLLPAVLLPAMRVSGNLLWRACLLSVQCNASIPVAAVLQTFREHRSVCRQYKGTAGGLAVQFGACKDSQTAADTASLSADKTSTGAATYLFIQAVEHLSTRHEALTYEGVLRDMQAQIRVFNQKNGRGVDGGRGERPIGGGGIMGSLISLALNEVSGAMGPVGTRAKGQTPQLSASEQFSLASRICM